MNTQTITNLILSQKPNLKQSSVDTYLYNLKQIKDDVGGDDDYKFLTDADTVLDKIKHRPISWQGTRLVSVITLLKAQGYTDDNCDALLKYVDVIKKGIKTYKDVAYTGIKNEKEQKNMITIDEYNDLIKKTEPKGAPNGLNEYYAYMFNFLLHIYKFCPSRADFSNMVIVSNVKDAKEVKNNVLLWNAKPKFIFKEYKTSKIYGDREVPITDPHVIKKIKWWLHFNKSDKWFLSSFKDGAQINQNSLTKILTRHFKKWVGKQISINTVRKIIASQHYDSHKILKDLAYKNGHSMSTQVIYVKNNK
jgi:hypothetical protein